MAGKLIRHELAKLTREDLKSIPTPEGTSTWTPIPHFNLIEALDGQLKARGIAITHEEYCVQGERMFGVLDTDYQATEEGGAAIGVRTSNDCSLSLQLAIGFRVLVCMNMCFYGDLIALRRKHTANLDLHTEFATGIGRYVNGYTKLQENIDWWKERTVSKERGKQLIYDIFLQKIVPVRLFHPVVNTYHNNLHEGQNLWTLHNAFTYHIQKLKPAPAFTSTLKLSRFFERVG